MEPNNYGNSHSGRKWNTGEGGMSNLYGNQQNTMNQNMGQSGMQNMNPSMIKSTFPPNNHNPGQNMSNSQFGVGQDIMAGSLMPGSRKVQFAQSHALPVNHSGFDTNDTLAFKRSKYANPQTGTADPDIFKTFSKTHSTAFENFPRGDPTKLGQTGLGMNPNTKIPDEYVDNLMKQIHFMKLELNLLQQKQDEDGGGGGIESLLQNDKRNHTDHVIMTADKFKDFTTKNKNIEVDLKSDIFLAQCLNENNKKRHE